MRFKRSTIEMANKFESCRQHAAADELGGGRRTRRPNSGPARPSAGRSPAGAA
jgi:hypothetical protein